MLWLSNSLWKCGTGYQCSAWIGLPGTISITEVQHSYVHFNSIFLQIVFEHCLSKQRQINWKSNKHYSQFQIISPLSKQEGTIQASGTVKPLTQSKPGSAVHFVAWISYKPIFWTVCESKVSFINILNHFFKNRSMSWHFVQYN